MVRVVEMHSLEIFESLKQVIEINTVLPNSILANV